MQAPKIPPRRRRRVPRGPMVAQGRSKKAQYGFNHPAIPYNALQAALEYLTKGSGMPCNGTAIQPTL
eukprot:4336923-Pyramimonas_sp.AAC.1